MVCIFAVDPQSRAFPSSAALSLILKQDILLRVQRITVQFCCTVRNISKGNCVDAMVPVGGVVVDPLRCVAATGVNGVLQLPIFQPAAALCLLNGAENVEELADTFRFVSAANGVLLNKCDPHKSGPGGKITRQTDGAHASAVFFQIQMLRKPILWRFCGKMHIIVQRE